MIYVNKIESRVTIEIKTKYYLELLMPETMKLLGNFKSMITKDENGKIMPHLEITELILVHFEIVNKDYWENSRILHTFLPNKSFDQLLDISSKTFLFLKTFDSESSFIEYGLLTWSKR